MIVLDVSAAIAMISGGEYGVPLRNLVLKGERIIAPELFKYELLNAVRKYAAADYISQNTATTWYDAGISLVDEFYPIGDMGAEILAEALATGHPSYDIAYLVLARRTASTLFTLDKRLMEVCAQRVANCIEKTTL